MNGSWSYTYDDLDRLSTATSPALSFQYLYDRFGNRLQQQLTSGTFYNPGPVTSSGANRIDGQCYDAAGNLLDETLNCAKYIYDAENRLVSTNGGPVYVYDAEGSRVAKQSGTPGAANIDLNEYLLDASGEQIAEFDGSGTLLHTNLYGGGRLWSTYTNGAMHYHTTDWLGTRRVQTEMNASVSLNCTSLPFGDGQNCTGTDSTEQHFTGKERDTESGLDYFGARYYAASYGRWTSPDPINLTTKRLSNPSNTLNKYAYGANNPVNYIDADGKDITLVYESGQSGHIALAAVNQDTGASAFLSFGPKSDSRASNLIGSPGTFDYPVDWTGLSTSEGSSSITLQTSPEETQKVIDAINHLESGQTPEFGLLSANCTTEVEDVLTDLGLNFLDLSPHSYWADVFGRVTQQGHDNPFSIYLGAPHEPGKDYGNPRSDLGMRWGLILQMIYDHRNDKPETFTVTTEEVDTLPNGTQPVDPK